MAGTKTSDGMTLQRRKVGGRSLVWTSVCLSVLGIAMSAPTVWAAPGAGTGKDSNSTMGGDGPIENELTPEVRAKVAKGLEWLAKHQSADGSFAEGGGDNSAIAALAGLAFLADGNMPGGGGAAGEGQYGANVDKVLEFTLKNCQESGLIAANGYGSPMYGHGFATLFLAEAYGMTSVQT